MDSIEEIMLVKGMKKEYFFGTENYEGIRNFITVCPLNTSSSGKININTASETVLKGISDRFNEEVVNNILSRAGRSQAITSRAPGASHLTELSRRPPG